MYPPLGLSKRIAGSNKFKVFTIGPATWKAFNKCSYFYESVPQVVVLEKFKQP
jgi:hypothetical protein